MDMLAIHPYGESSKTPPTALHLKSTSISIADYPKLVKLLRDVFRGTAQRGASLPILYAEYGVQTRIPSDKLGAYTNLGDTAAVDAVSETMQAAYYRQAIRLAYCQPTVAGLLFFHVSDEPDLDRWQSGLFYTDDTPKSDLELVKSTAQAAQAGTLTCPKAKPQKCCCPCWTTRNRSSAAKPPSPWDRLAARRKRINYANCSAVTATLRCAPPLRRR